MRPVERDRVRALAAKQAGFITRSQLYQAGCTRTKVDRWLRNRELTRAFAGVYAFGHLPGEPVARAWAGLLAAGGDAALAGYSAGHLLRVIRAWKEPIEVVTAANRSRPGLLVRRTTTLTARDVWLVHGGLRITSPARTALDLVPRLSAARRIRLINELRMEQRLEIRDLRDVIARNQRHRGSPILRELIGDAQPQPTRSMLENAFLSMIGAHGLPVPVMNEFVGGHRVDAFFSEHGLVVELDGWTTHGWKNAFEADRATPMEVMALTGYPTLRLSYDQTTRLVARTAAQLSAILARLERRRSSGSSSRAATAPRNVGVAPRNVEGVED